MKKEVGIREKKQVFWHALSSEKVIEKLQSNLNGLSEGDVSERLETYGKNEIKKIEKLRPLKLLLEQFKSFFVLLLIIAAVISFLVTHFIDGYVIFGIVILNASIGFIQDYKAERTIQALKKMLVTKAKVIRSGILKEIPANEVVPGDILVLQEGDKVVADSRIMESRSLQVNEAILTGESFPIDKTSNILKPEIEIYERTNMLYNGTSVVRGSCKAIVVATGMQTEFGRIASMVQKTKEEKTPLIKKIDDFAKKLGLIIIAISILTGIIAFLVGIDMVESLLTSISLAVAAVPEGLPAVITICLALTIQRMYKSKSLIRKLPAAETLGRVTVICTDKTGTITGEQMTVTDLYFDNKIVEAKNLDNKIKNKALGMLFKINCLCNNSYIEKLDDKENFIGDPTEIALLRIASKFGFDKKELTEKEPKQKEFVFTSKRKLMSIVREANNEQISYVKGSPETILENCNKELIGNTALRLTSKRRQELLRVYEEMASQGLRVLGFAYKPLKKGTKSKTTQQEAESELIFVGFQGMLDPPRPEIKDAIKATQEAGIKVKVITGDSILTAKTIASQIGLIGKSIEGKDFDKLSGEELKKVVNDTVIFARVTPEQKLKIVSILKEQKEIVAVTGDGVNDAPALKRADIGIAMGIKGSDVARETSDVILLDDNFASIVKAIKEGRRTYSNIKKFIKFLLATNLGEIEIILFSLILGLPLPLLPLHILWVNLVTDSAPALALSVEHPEKDLMKQKPKPNENILHGMTYFILFASLLAFVTTLVAFLLFMSNIDKARTAALTAIVLFEIFFVFTCRTNEPIQKIGVFSNKFLLWAVVVSVALQIIVLYSPLNTIMHLVPLNLKDILIVLSLSISGLVLFEIGKNIKYRKIR